MPWRPRLPEWYIGPWIDEYYPWQEYNQPWLLENDGADWTPRTPIS